MSTVKYITVNEVHTGQVLSIGKQHESPEPNTADNRNDETDAKHGNDLELLFLRYLPEVRGRLRRWNGYHRAYDMP